MRVTVFTTVLGLTDPLRTPRHYNAQARYIVFADQLVRVPPYELVRVPPADRHRSRLLSRMLKILANHPAIGKPDFVLWHDAAFQLHCDPIAIADTVPADVEMVAFRHPHRDTIEAEAEAIAKLKYVTPEVLQQQVRDYRAEGFPPQEGISSTGFSLRRTTPHVAEFNEVWWKEVRDRCWRDQMSVDYAIWKTGLKAQYIPGHYRDNPHAKWFSPSRAERQLLKELQQPQ